MDNSSSETGWENVLQRVYDAQDVTEPFTIESNLTMKTYMQMHEMLIKLLKKLPKVKHGYLDKDKTYTIVWVNERLIQLNITIRPLENNELELSIITEKNKKNRFDPVIICISNISLYSWLSNLVDEIFLETL